MHHYDPRALRVAQLTSRLAQLEFAILFGSRARGDHQPDSDIDLMVVDYRHAGSSCRYFHIQDIADRAARVAYGNEPPHVQLLWRGAGLFRYGVRHVNSVESNAVREGVFLPGNARRPSVADYADVSLATEWDWTKFNNHLFLAKDHLEKFRQAADDGAGDAEVGRHAHLALELGLKAVLAATVATQTRPERKTRDIGLLLDAVRRHNPDLLGNSISIDPDIFTEYAQQTPRREPELTKQADYRQRAIADAEAIISVAENVRKRKSAAA